MVTFLESIRWRRPAVGITDVREVARRKLPRPVFDFIDGGAENELTLRSNESAFASLGFVPQALTDVSKRSQRVRVLGLDLPSPVLLAPAGLARMAHRDGEIAAARAAARAGTVYTLSTAASASIEEVAAACSGPLWLQLYVWSDRGATAALVDRARAAGYHALCFTIDVPLSGRRERDVRNGLTIPPKPAGSTWHHYARHPLWVRQALLGSPITFRNFIDSDAGGGNSAVALGNYVNSQLNPSMSWDDLRWLREAWSGPLLVKGIMSAHDAREVVKVGADAVVVSNHGGRQLDGLPATIDVLPEIVDAVAGDAEVLMDSGVRRGSDVVKALALGARAVLVGRPYLYGLAMDGEDGALRVLEMLRDEIDRVQALLGVPDLKQMHRGLVRR